MGEMDPVHQPNGLDKLRESRLRPQSVRTILWFASYRIMDSKMFVQADRKQAGVYFETIFNAMDKIEVQDAAFAGKEKRPVKTLLDMGHMMAWAASEVRTATFPGGDVPANDWRATELHMELNIALFEEYLGMAYQKYEEYQEAQARAQEASWLGLKWF